MSTKDHVLVLNKQWIPIDSCTVYTAFSKLFSESAKFMDLETSELHGVQAWLDLPVWNGMPCLIASKGAIRIPEVMVLVDSEAFPKRRVMQFSRRNLLRRDKHTCQYCGKTEELTIDHVFPRTKGGKSVWKNCVMACLRCNSRKADRTPEEANMVLKQKPFEPAWSPVFRVAPERRKESWKRFLPESAYNN